MVGRGIVKAQEFDLIPPMLALRLAPSQDG